MYQIRNHRFRTRSIMFLTAVLITCFMIIMDTQAQSVKTLEILRKSTTFQPLEEIVLGSQIAGTVSVQDSRSREYFRSAVSGKQSFFAGGAPRFTDGQIIRQKKEMLFLKLHSMLNQKRISLTVENFPNSSNCSITVCLFIHPLVMKKLHGREKPTGIL